MILPIQRAVPLKTASVQGLQRAKAAALRALRAVKAMSRTTLLRRLVLLYALTMLVIGVGLTTVTTVFIWPPVESLEKREASHSISDVSHSLSAQAERLTELASTYGAWDEAYDYVRDRNPSFAKSNLDVAALNQNTIDAVIVQGDFGFERYSAARGTGAYPLRVLSAMREALARSAMLRLNQADSIKSGIILCEGKAVIISARRIVRTDGSGKPTGFIAFARILDSAAIQEIGGQIGVDFRLTEAETESKKIARPRFGAYNFAPDANSEFVRAAQVINDAYARPRIQITVFGKPEILLLGQTMLVYLSITLAVILMLIGFGFCFIMHRAIVAPVSSLIMGVNALARGEDAINLKGNPPAEIGLLAASFEAAFARANTESALHRQAAKRAHLARIAADKANAAKSEFLATMSHELRTPLSSIISYSELMFEGAEEDGRHVDAADHKVVISAAQHLLGLINDVLDFAKIEAQRMQVDFVKFDVRGLVQEVARTTQPLMEAKGNEFTLIVAPDSGEAFSDAFKIKQCLLNLLSNAAKFTENGRICLTVRREMTDGKELISFEIADTGIGIAQDKIQLLFQPFTQADSDITRKYGGTGLGLSITRKMALLLGGDVTAASVLGEGSVFTFSVAANPDGAGQDARKASEEFVI